MVERAPIPPAPAPGAAPERVQSYNEPGYRYELFSNLSTYVYKDDVLTYTIDAEGTCDCPGFRHRGTCKHSQRAEQMLTRWSSRRFESNLPAGLR